MWGATWGDFFWGRTINVPAMGFFGILVFSCLVGVSGVLLLRSKRMTAGAFAVLLVLVPFTAFATTFVTTVPFVFTNGTVANATQVNADFAALTPIIGSNAFGISSGFGANSFVFPPTPDFTAPRNLTCIVTVQSVGTAANAATDIQFNSAIQIGSTQTRGSAGNLFFNTGSNNGSDNNLSTAYTQVFPVTAGSVVSFGAFFNIFASNIDFVPFINTVYYCV